MPHQPDQLQVSGMGVSSLMNDIELACLLLPRGKG